MGVDCVLSNREISITILVGLSIIYMLCSKNLRAPLSSLCKAVILVIKEPAFRLLFCYQIICLCILSFVLLKKNLDLWMIKDYILIVVFSIIPTIVKINSVENQSIIKHYLLSSFTLTGILAFITDTYNFSIIGELILNITLILLVIFQVVSEEQSITSVKAFCNFCLFILLMFTITHSFLELIKDLDSRDTFLILLDYFSDFIFWTLNIPLLFAWRYIGQFDVMENFLSTKKTARSLFKHFIELLFKKFKYSSLSFDKHIITNIQIGGLGKRCYLITVNNSFQKKDINTMLLLFKIGSVDACIYRKNHVPKVLPYKIEIIDAEKRNTIKSWVIPNIDDDFSELTNYY